MKIPRTKSRVEVLRDRLVKPGDIKPVMIHDRIKIDPNPKAMSDFDQIEELLLSAISSSQRPPLILGTKVKAIKQVISD